MIIDCISDLHGFYPKLKGGDLLIVAGDLTASNRGCEYWDFVQWLDCQAYKKKIVVAGNHDGMLDHDRNPQEKYKLNIVEDIEYLCDSGTQFEGLKIWGSPWTKTFEGMNPLCKAFTVDSEDELMDRFEKIPYDTNILITHSPPLGVLDKTQSGLSAGSPALFGWLKYVERPRLHVFGHIHEAYGQKEFFASYNDKMMISVNASHVNERYQPVNKPIRIVL